MRPLLAWAPQHAVCLQRSRLPPNQQSFGEGGHVLGNPFALCALLPRASVCICCTNEWNKSFRGPSVRGSSLWGKAVVVGLKWTLLSGQLLWGWQWENSRQREWWRLDPATSSLQPFALNDRWPSLLHHVKSVTWPPGHMLVPYTCRNAHMHTDGTWKHCRLLFCQPKDNQSFHLCPWSEIQASQLQTNSNLSTLPADLVINTYIQTCTLTVTPTESFSSRQQVWIC